MVFPDQFKNHILPDKVHILNVSFLVPRMRREFGGCAGNIAYNLKLLGGDPIPMATVGQDFAPYRDYFDQLGIRLDQVKEIPELFTPQAFITTDLDNNQITAFHPGAMQQAHITKVAARDDIKLGIVAPDGRDAMLEHAEQFKAAGIPFVFDPGQGLPMFDGKELAHFVDLASWVVVNDYEGKMLSQRTGWSLAEISKRVDGLVVTLAAEGCEVWTSGEREHVPAVAPTAVVEPTGCGDAWRGALLFGLEQGWALARCAALGNQLGALKIAQRGPQNYQVDRQALGI
jgi:adenosine kinase